MILFLPYEHSGSFCEILISNNFLKYFNNELFKKICIVCTVYTMYVFFRKYTMHICFILEFHNLHLCTYVVSIYLCNYVLTNFKHIYSSSYRSKNQYRKIQYRYSLHTYKGYKAVLST